MTAVGSTSSDLFQRLQRSLVQCTNCVSGPDLSSLGNHTYLKILNAVITAKIFSLVQSEDQITHAIHFNYY